MSKFEDRVAEVLKDYKADIMQLMLAGPEHCDLQPVLDKMDECCIVIQNIDTRVKQIANDLTQQAHQNASAEDEQSDDSPPADEVVPTDHPLWERFRDTVAGITNPAPEALDLMDEAQRDLFNSLSDYLSKVYEALKNDVSRTWQAIMAAMQTALAAKRVMDTAAIKKSQKSMKRDIEAMSKMLKELRSQVAASNNNTQKQFTELSDKISEFGSDLSNLRSTLQELDDTTKSIKDDTGAIGEALDNMFDSLARQLSACCTSLHDSISSLAEALSSVLTLLVEHTTLLQQLKSEVHNISNAVGGTIANTGAETNQRLRAVQSELHRIRGLL